MVERFLLRNNPAFFQTASLLRTKEWSVFYIQTSETSKLTVRATKKVASLSVDRHKMVRRTREAWKAEMQKETQAQAKFVLVVFPTRRTLEMEFSLLQKAAAETIATLQKRIK